MTRERSKLQSFYCSPWDDLMAFGTRQGPCVIITQDKTTSVQQTKWSNILIVLKSLVTIVWL